MGRILIGNFKGPQGDQGTTGTDGRRGSRWTQGTAVTGTSTTPAVFSGTGITDALVDDVYMNTETGNIYRCTLSGDAGTAQWAYTGSLKGPTGATGAPGKDGATGAVDASTQIEFSDIDTYVEMQSGNSIATLFSKIKKGLADLFSGKLDKTKVIASTNITEPGFVMDGKTVADAFSQLNSNLVQYPDYAVAEQNFTSIEKDVTYKTTISQNAIVLLYGASGSANESIFHRLIINGWAVSEGYTVSHMYNYIRSGLYPVKKGDKVEALCDASYVRRLYIIPYRSQNNLA